MTLPCSVQNFKTIGQLTGKLWKNETSRDLSLRRVSDGYRILLHPPDVLCNFFRAGSVSMWVFIVALTGLVTPYGDIDLGQHRFR